MQRRAVVFALLFIVIAVASSCRRTPPPQPEVMPKVETTTVAPEPEPERKVESPEREFEQPPQPDPDVLSEDLAEATQQAHDRGWIADAFFQYDASTLDADAQAALTKSATWLREHPEFRLLIEGHCDERGTEQYNLALGDRRASTAADFLATLGVDRSRVQVVSYGEERPFEEGSSEEVWAQNRRAHLVLAGRTGF